MDTVIKIDCEWDVGQDSFLFNTMGEALLWCEENPYLKETETGIEGGIEALREEGLLSFREVEIWMPTNSSI